MRALAAALALLAPLASAQTAERDARPSAPTYGEVEYRASEGHQVVPRRLAPTSGEAAAGRTVYRSGRVVSEYYDGSEARQVVEREPAPRWIRDEAAAFRTTPQPRTARRGAIDGVSYADGSHYRGDLRRGLPHGQGTMRYGDGSSYDGAFRDGVPDGAGTYRAATGDVLSGTFRDGVLANGEVDYAAGHRYQGALLAGQPHGQGTIDYADGSSYQGAFQSGRPDGWGSYLDRSGDYYEGNWTRGRMDDADAPPTSDVRGGDARFAPERRPGDRRVDRRGPDGAWR